MYTFEGAADAAQLVLDQYDAATDSFEGEKTGPFWDAVELAHQLGRFAQGQRIAVIDTGFDTSIPFLNSQSQAWPTQPGSHVTHGSAVALLIHEVAPKAQIDLYPVFDWHGYNEDLALNALSAAVESNADVINMSFGETLDFDDLYNTELPVSTHNDPIVAIAEDRLSYPDWRMRLNTRPPTPLESATRLAIERGCSVIAAAGNKYEGIFTPAVLRGVVAAGFLKVGQGFSGGVELKAANFAELYQQNPFMDVALVQPPLTLGSSFAAPLISGFAATMPDRSLIPAYVTAASLAGTADDFLSGLDFPLSQERLGAMLRLYGAAVEAEPHKHWSQPLHDIKPCPECALFAQSVYVNGGLALMRIGELDDADRLLRAAALFAPSSSAAAANLAMLIAIRAEMARTAGDLDTVRLFLSASLGLMMRAASLQPDNPFYGLRVEEFRAAIDHPDQWELAP